MVLYVYRLSKSLFQNLNFFFWAVQNPVKRLWTDYRVRIAFRREKKIVNGIEERDWDRIPVLDFN